MMLTTHVLPVGDSIEHELSITCPCGPRGKSFFPTGGYRITHQALIEGTSWLVYTVHPEPRAVAA